MSQTANYNPPRSLVEGNVIDCIQKLSDAALATLEVFLDRWEDLRKQGTEALPPDYKLNPDKFTMGFFDVHSQIFVQMMDEYTKSKEHDGQQIFEKAILLSITSLYLAENMVEGVDFSGHPLVSGDVGQPAAPPANP